MRIMKNISNYRRTDPDRARVVFGLWPGRGAKPVQDSKPPRAQSSKAKRPLTKNVLKVKLPRAEEATLTNGLRVVLLRSTKSRPSTCRWWC